MENGVKSLGFGCPSKNLIPRKSPEIPPKKTVDKKC
jgi:hypothetical protein